MVIYKMDKQQGPTLQHRELYSISCDNHNGKEYEEVCVCVCVYTHIHIYIERELNHSVIQQKLTHIVNQLYFNSKKEEPGSR